LEKKLELRIRKVSKEEREANPDRDFLAVATGTAGRGFQPATLEYWEGDNFGGGQWFPVSITE